MPTFSRFKRTLVFGVVALVSVAAVACSGADQPTATTQPEASPEPTATSSPISVQNPTVTPSSPVGDAASALDGLSALEIARSQEQVLVDLFEKTVDSVVKIETASPGGVGEGSGWLWDDQGHIVTNYHVVDGASSIEVFFYDGREYQARVIGFNGDADLAVIKIDAGGDPLQPAVLGNSSDLSVGQTAVALGNPFGEDFTMTTGIVSALGRLKPSGFSISRFSIPSVIQTDAAINPGNSGGPLLDLEGRVIGINTQIQSNSGGSQGVGFAVPVDLAKRVVPSLIEDGSHSYSFMGITGVGLGRQWREGFDFASDRRGAYITSVEPGSPAARAGLVSESGAVSSSTGQPTASTKFDGDLIVSVVGQPVTSMDDLIAYLALNTSPGDDIVLVVLRGGTETSVVLTLGER
jgi:2-alkenal reductase